MKTKPDKHPVDRMADLKEQISELQKQYNKLRDKVICGKISPRGNNYYAVVAQPEYRRTDYDMAKELLSEGIYDMIIHTEVKERVSIHKMEQVQPVEVTHEIATHNPDQQLIDRFINRNKSFLREMDERNRKTDPMYSLDYACLSDENAGERKRAVRRILDLFLSDYEWECE